MAVCGAGTSADCDKVSQNIRLRLKLVMQQVCSVEDMNMCLIWRETSCVCSVRCCSIHVLKCYFQLQEVGEKEVSVFTALKLLCKILFENSNIAVRIMVSL